MQLFNLPARASRVSFVAGLAAAAIFSSSMSAQTPTSAPPITLDAMTVLGRADDMLDVAATASQGRVAAAELNTRPLLRRGELLEVVPGLVVTQHSGGGKANQYFLRGYNLDHGTDLALFAEGVPINLRTHGHGQGYADLNWIIPELVEGIRFNKGPFYPAVGDFSAAGAAELNFFTALPRDFASISWGENGHRRAVVGGSTTTGQGVLTAAAEWSAYDGPFVNPEDFERANVFLRYHQSTADRSLTFTAMGYDATWMSTDQIPARAIAAGTLNRFDTIDPTNGGASSRFATTFEGEWRRADATTRLNLFATHYDLSLYSNFTYFLDDPADGDQFEQVDDRIILGGSWSQEWRSASARYPRRDTIGLQAQVDLIDEVGLHRTAARQRLGTVRSDAVKEGSLGVFWENETRWTDRFRTTGGLRADIYGFDVDSDLAANSGRRDDTIVSPKLAAIYQLGKATELYAGAGFGFHSNDARGTTVTIDPADGSPASAVDPLARSRGFELGWRTSAWPGLVSTVALFQLENESELVFVGDAGGTEASGASRRHGVEWTNFYQPLPWLSLEADLALTHARFKNAPGADYIPGAIDRVFSGGVRVGRPEGWFSEMRLRHFGPRVLTEDGSIRGDGSTLVNARLGWRSNAWEVTCDVFNVFDRADNDIEYYYASRLPGEPAAGVDDVHLHPVEPLAVRFTVTWRH
ncbi:TonB-dependent receptor [Synoicihabitans lomoniglobus]|uniref:TonB-dependent receptor n=1 Tax=Synoicihabitans lomoniglobus TaxID=2909285 RepID=A0AAF0CN53_9BACT|nr:TonB-dependent receptor [Opitutaceae bacterium LMO-M01]WED63980.1 TonB-dependent receptor [Opitutaceae bacterium LMO-M01]